MEMKTLNYVYKINKFGKISKMTRCFLKNLNFFLSSRAALDPLAGCMFETPAIRTRVRQPIQIPAFHCKKIKTSFQALFEMK